MPAALQLRAALYWHNETIVPWQLSNPYNLELQIRLSEQLTLCKSNRSGISSIAAAGNFDAFQICLHRWRSIWSELTCGLIDQAVTESELISNWFSNFGFHQTNHWTHSSVWLCNWKRFNYVRTQIKSVTGHSDHKVCFLMNVLYRIYHFNWNWWLWKGVLPYAITSESRSVVHARNSLHLDGLKHIFEHCSMNESVADFMKSQT